jgi:hypothetical protein
MVFLKIFSLLFFQWGVEVGQILHCSPASHERQQKGNPVPEGIIWQPCSIRIWIWEPGASGWDSLESETVKYSSKSWGTQTQNDCTGKDQQQS